MRFAASRLARQKYIGARLQNHERFLLGHRSILNLHLPKTKKSRTALLCFVCCGGGMGILAKNSLVVATPRSSRPSLLPRPALLGGCPALACKSRCNSAPHYCPPATRKAAFSRGNSFL